MHAHTQHRARHHDGYAGFKTIIGAIILAVGGMLLINQFFAGDGATIAKDEAYYRLMTHQPQKASTPAPGTRLIEA